LDGWQLLKGSAKKISARLDGISLEIQKTTGQGTENKKSKCYWSAAILIHFFKQSQVLNVNTCRPHQKGITRKMSQELLLELMYLRIYIPIVSTMGAVSSLEQ